MNTTDPTNGQLAAADLRKAAESLESAIGAPEGIFEEHLREQQARDAAENEFPAPPTDDALDLPPFLTSDTLDDEERDIQIPNISNSLKLGDGYDAALIGATITGHFAYSLTKLATIEADMRAISVEAAREIIAAQVVQVVREWGAGCPVFIDDSLVMSDSEASRIIVPGSAQFPGVEVGPR